VIGRPSRHVVCLDLARDRMAVVELADRAVVRWFSRPLPDGALQNGAPVDPTHLGGMLRQSLALAGVEGRRARIALPDEAAVSRQIKLPPMPKRDLVRTMRYEAERHVPFPIQRARWSWDVLRRGEDEIRVYLVAAWQDVVDLYAEMARAAGLQPEVLEPRAIAVARAIGRDEALLVDASRRRVYLTLYQGGHPVLVDEMSSGADIRDRREALSRLLQRAFRHQSNTSGGSARLAPVLLAGDLETSGIELPVSGGAVSDVLNGNLPAGPRGFRAGGYLANLGLGMRT
jgi:Tfp pilus assembly PilM family ATPase